MSNLKPQTLSYECPYYNDGRETILEYIFPTPGEQLKYDDFLKKGYRRHGDVFYKNVCLNCDKCLPIRLDPSLYKMSRSQKRAWIKNQDIRVEIANPGKTNALQFITREKFDLYRKYIVTKHQRDENEDYIRTIFALHAGYPSIIEMDYYIGERLIGVGIVDESKEALSSNYFYYDTDFLDRRLGIFSIIVEINLARALEKKHYYLGFYVEDNPKMSYKKAFKPNQIYRSGRWEDFITE